jgi:Peptidase C13 family
MHETFNGSPARGVPPGIASRLRDAARIALFMRVPEERLHPTWLEIVAAAVLTICVPTLYGAVMLGSDGRPDIWEIPQVLLHVPLALAAASVVATILRRDDSVALLLFATFLAGFVIDAVTLVAWGIVEDSAAMRQFGPLEAAFFYAPLAWLALAVARFAITLAPQSAPRQAWILVALVALLAFPLGYLHPERSLWVNDWSKDADGDANARARASAGSEEVFYRQPELLARELAAVEPGRKGVVDVFFVGMAGYGPQDVFMREIDSVARLMRERFGAGGHIVKLVNNPKTLLTGPIASSTSLRAALKRIAEAMDVEEDVLVLFLTTHGSADHRLSLELSPLRFKELDPAALRAILDESGIRNRVVIISACYAGGFVEKLRDERTLVITAAAPNRNSFGCSNENEWTYFGKAYFDEALRNTFSFTEAFELAKPVIEERERAQKYDPSEPQMSAGAAIRVKLAELEAQLRKGPPQKN